MANSYFQFKQFRIEQGQCAMKVSTDAVVLGAAVTPSLKVSAALDIGSGTGVLALMIAQKFPEARIEAVELDRQAADQATENFRNSPWPERVTLIHEDFISYKQARSRSYDLILCNPPYYPGHLKSPDQRKSLAHHQGTLNLNQLLEGVAALLREEGQFWVVLPPFIMDEFQVQAKGLGLFPCFCLELFDHPGSKGLRKIMAFGRKEFDRLPDSRMYIKDALRNFTPSYQSFLKDFMLYF